MRDFFRREFAPIGTDDDDEPVELLESERMYRAGLRENAEAGQAADDKTDKHSNKKRADKIGTQTNVYQTDNAIDSGKATKHSARPAKTAHHSGFISVSPALIALCALAPLLGQGRLMAMTLAVLAMHEAAHIACARMLGVPIGRLRLTPLGASLELDARLITPRNEALIAAAGPIASALCVVLLCLLTGHGLDDTLLIDTAGVALTLTLFNLMPASPLDGGRILHALLRKRFGERRASDVCGILGMIMALWLMVCVLVSACGGRLPVMLMAASGCVFSLAAGEYLGDTQTAWQLAWTHGDELRRGACLPVRVVAVDADTPVRALLRGLRRGETTVFRVTDQQMHCLGEISETDLLTHCVDDPDAKARALLSV